MSICYAKLHTWHRVQYVASCALIDKMVAYAMHANLFSLSYKKQPNDNSKIAIIPVKN